MDDRTLIRACFSLRPGEWLELSIDDVERQFPMTAGDPLDVLADAISHRSDLRALRSVGGVIVQCQDLNERAPARRQNAHWGPWPIPLPNSEGVLSLERSKVARESKYVERADRTR